MLALFQIITQTLRELCSRHSFQGSFFISLTFAIYLIIKSDNSYCLKTGFTALYVPAPQQKELHNNVFLCELVHAVRWIIAQNFDKRKGRKVAHSSTVFLFRAICLTKRTAIAVL